MGGEGEGPVRVVTGDEALAVVEVRKHEGRALKAPPGSACFSKAPFAMATLFFKGTK